MEEIGWPCQEKNKRNAFDEAIQSNQGEVSRRTWEFKIPWQDNKPHNNSFVLLKREPTAGSDANSGMLHYYYRLERKTALNWQEMFALSDPQSCQVGQAPNSLPYCQCLQKVVLVGILPMSSLLNLAFHINQLYIIQVLISNTKGLSVYTKSHP